MYFEIMSAVDWQRRTCPRILRDHMSDTSCGIVRIVIGGMIIQFFDADADAHTPRFLWTYICRMLLHMLVKAKSGVVDRGAV